MRSIFFCSLAPILVFACSLSAAQVAEPWQSAYSGEDASGGHVIAYWNFDHTGDAIKDVSGNGHDGRLAGASRRTDSRFGGCVESFPGWPVEDVRAFAA